MKHIWVVESKGSRKWGPYKSYLTSDEAGKIAIKLQANNPGLLWRVKKYVREAK